MRMVESGVGGREEEEGGGGAGLGRPPPGSGDERSRNKTMSAETRFQDSLGMVNREGQSGCRLRLMFFSHEN